MKIIALISYSLVVLLLNSGPVEPDLTETTRITSESPSEIAGMEPYLGEVIMFAGNFAPRGWALCEGQILPISNHQALFAIIGTQYGGDGRTTFALPDLTHESGVRYIIALNGIFPPRN